MRIWDALLPCLLYAVGAWGLAAIRRQEQRELWWPHTDSGDLSLETKPKHRPPETAEAVPTTTRRTSGRRVVKPVVPYGSDDGGSKGKATGKRGRPAAAAAAAERGGGSSAAPTLQPITCVGFDGQLVAMHNCDVCLLSYEHLRT